MSFLIEFTNEEAEALCAAYPADGSTAAASSREWALFHVTMQQTADLIRANRVREGDFVQWQSPVREQVWVPGESIPEILHEYLGRLEDKVVLRRYDTVTGRMTLWASDAATTRLRKDARPPAPEGAPVQGDDPEDGAR